MLIAGDFAAYLFFGLLAVEQHVLSDPNQFPMESIVFSHIQKTKPLWISLFDYIHDVYPDSSEEWRYYRDGKSWLLKMTRKKKTVFWLSILQGSFQTTFYFMDKSGEELMASELSDGLKEQFKRSKPDSKLKGITVRFLSKRDLEDAKILIGIKTRMK